MRIKTFLALLFLLGAVTGCASIGWPTAAPQPSAHEPLVFYSWAGYMPQDILNTFQRGF